MVAKAFLKFLHTRIKFTLFDDTVCTLLRLQNKTSRCKFWNIRIYLNAYPIPIQTPFSSIFLNVH